MRQEGRPPLMLSMTVPISVNLALKSSGGDDDGDGGGDDNLRHLPKVLQHSTPARTWR